MVWVVLDLVNVRETKLILFLPLEETHRTIFKFYHHSTLIMEEAFPFMKSFVFFDISNCFDFVLKRREI